MTRIDLTDKSLDNVVELIGGGEINGSFALRFCSPNKPADLSVIITRTDARALWEMLSNEFADEYNEPSLFDFQDSQP